MPGAGGPNIAVLIPAGANGFTNPSFAGRGEQFGSRRLARRPRLVDAPTQLLPLVPRPRPVFVDDTGRRGLVLGWLSVGVALLAVSLVVVFWVSQATSSGAVGPSTVCGTAAAAGCGVPAGA